MLRHERTPLVELHAKALHNVPIRHCIAALAKADVIYDVKHAGSEIPAACFNRRGL